MISIEIDWSDRYRATPYRKNQIEEIISDAFKRSFVSDTSSRKITVKFWDLPTTQYVADEDLVLLNYKGTDGDLAVDAFLEFAHAKDKGKYSLPTSEKDPYFLACELRNLENSLEYLEGLPDEYWGAEDPVKQDMLPAEEKSALKYTNDPYEKKVMRSRLLERRSKLEAMANSLG